MKTSGAVINDVSFVVRVFWAVRDSGVVEASGSIFFRNVRMPGREGPQLELKTDVSARFYE